MVSFRPVSALPTAATPPRPVAPAAAPTAAAAASRAERAAATATAPAPAAPAEPASETAVQERYFEEMISSAADLLIRTQLAAIRTRAD